jgi:hypothetical protein
MMKKYSSRRKKLRLSYLRSILNYDPSTGLFTWKESRGSVAKGSLAGSLYNNGYISIMIDGLAYGAHRLAWLYVYGQFPKEEVDHKDGVRHNNCISNLREATSRQNCINSKVKKTSSSGVKGVSFISGKWVARIKLGNSNIYIGRYDTIQEAQKAYENKAIEIHGEYARSVNG